MYSRQPNPGARRRIGRRRKAANEIILLFSPGILAKDKTRRIQPIPRQPPINMGMLVFGYLQQCRNWARIGLRRLPDHSPARVCYFHNAIVH